jgi:hypothetical protein
MLPILGIMDSVACQDMAVKHPTGRGLFSDPLQKKISTKI